MASMDDRSQIRVSTDERTQVHSARSTLVVTHPITSRAWRNLTLVNESLNSRHRKPYKLAIGKDDIIIKAIKCASFQGVLY